MNARRAGLVLLALAPLLAATTAEEKQGEAFQGFLVAASATDVYAPDFTFRVSGWSSSWGNCKLLELVEDGKTVKKGDVVARFEFGAKDALNWINDRIRRAQADEQQGRIGADRDVDSLTLEGQRKTIESRLAGLNLEKERAVSRQQAQIYRLAHQLAEFEVEASAQRLASRRQSRAAERAYLEGSVTQARADLDRYAFYERRFTLLAPHDGVVRHAFNPRERRKVKKADGLQSGSKVLSVGRDSTLAVRFFVPEHQLSRVKVGAKVTVVSVASAEEYSAEVKSIGFFPQELGFLLENEDLPNGREKAFEVKAEFATPPKDLNAGTEVRVRVAPR